MRNGRLVVGAVLLVASFAVPGPAVSAASGFDSAYAGESAFLTLYPGRSGTFSVFFFNVGATSWVKGTATQVDLAACLEDKTICDRQDPSEAAFDPGTWLSAGRYATHAQATVAPGQIGTFTYDVKVRGDQAPGRYRFNGDLVVRSTGARIHPEGYFHDLSVPPAVCAPGSVTMGPSFKQSQVGIPHTQTATVICADGTAAAANMHLTFVVDAAATDTGNADQLLTAITDAKGVATVTWTRTSPGTDSVTAYPTATPIVRGTAITRWTIALRVLDCEPTSSAVQRNLTTRDFTITATSATTGARLATAPLNVTVRTAITSGTATINGGNARAIPDAGATVAVVTTAPDGTAVITVSGSDATVSPRVFLDEDGSGSLGGTEFRADCPSTTFAY